MTNRRRLSAFYRPGHFGLSYELYPPRTDAGVEDLFRHLTELVRFNPSFITCTYGAGGSTRDKTLDIVARVKRDFRLPAAAHLTCVGATRDDLRSYLREARARDIEFVVALRGDPPKGETEFRPVSNGLSHANELVALIRSEFDHFGIAVAGYPEVHQEASSPDADLEHLKRKVDAGADVVITQLFYNNADFYRFRDRCAAAGIDLAIVPGILPITNLAQIRRITSLCGAKLPGNLLKRLEAYADDPQGQFDVGVYHATKQVEQLSEEGCPGVHFYVLNKSQATAQILRALTLPPPGRTPN
ncbi:MAG: methylenetetrahydrofolate reductase [NAD(P)H] [Candidatus Hydrogenedentes bacterium]|nr:methylenetetrahydrofolate reductase [NAD(P)H] [Candidatus Hydrogenedentota bacterium]